MIYIHVPFCRSFCTYCGFYSEVASRCGGNDSSSRQDAYVSVLVKEIRTRRYDIERVFASNDVNTLYIGGGTPSVLPVSAYARILAALRETGLDCRFREFTVEVNPEDVVEKGSAYVDGLVELGVNRISMGIQSFDDGILRFMNRRHSAQTAVKAYHILEAAGVDNISIDLIFGLPQLTDALWGETLDKALNISSKGVPPKHISAYQLSVEPDSMLEELIAGGKWTEADDELCRRQYDALCEALGKSGYSHYEISNFAQPGYEAVHNSAYWRHVPYVGLGPGAHSYLATVSGRGVPMAPSPAQGCGNASFTPQAPMLQSCRAGAAGGAVRQWNVESLEKYLQAGRTGDFSVVQEGEVLDEGQLAMEKVMLGLRTSAGLPETVLRECCSGRAVDEALASGDLVRSQEDRMRIPESRFFVSDNIILKICVIE